IAAVGPPDDAIAVRRAPRSLAIGSTAARSPDDILRADPTRSARCPRLPRVATRRRTHRAPLDVLAARGRRRPPDHVGGPCIDIGPELTSLDQLVAPNE